MKTGGKKSRSFQVLSLFLLARHLYTKGQKHHISQEHYFLFICKCCREFK